eukprot:jgi/Botrbrau1/1816/Bobra.146_1s0014.1
MEGIATSYRLFRPTHAFSTTRPRRYFSIIISEWGSRRVHNKCAPSLDMPGAVEHVLDRRLFHAVMVSAIPLFVFRPNASSAIGFKKELKKKKVPIDDYIVTADGLQYYDLSTGDGKEVEEGNKVKVHFDCLYKGIDVASSRAARLLGGNRTVAEPFEFTAGQPIGKVGVKKISDSANGLFSGFGGPQPPPILSTAVLGMRQGGKRSVIVPPELGYGTQGLQEIPPNASFELQVEILEIL